MKITVTSRADSLTFKCGDVIGKTVDYEFETLDDLMKFVARAREQHGCVCTIEYDGHPDFDPMLVLEDEWHRRTHHSL